MKKFALCLMALLGASFAEAKVTLPQLFQSGMVLQRGKVIPVWGKAEDVCIELQLEDHHHLKHQISGGISQ
jgi:hypothetical protein